jgi:glycosyltransferase involved in cell wall biosynthesis
MPPLRILLFAQQMAAFRSGVGTYSAGLAAGLAARGHRVTAVVPRGEEPSLPGVEIVSVPRPPRWDPTPGGWISLGLAFRKVLAERGSDHDLGHFTDAREAWACAGRSPVPVTGMANDSYAADWLVPAYPRGVFADRLSRSLYYRLLRAVEKPTYAGLSGLIANSAHVARAVEARYRLGPGKARVIYYGLPAYPAPVPVPLPGHPAILFVGGNFQRKGLGVLLAAASLLVAEFPAITIHVAGRDRNQGALEERARLLGVRDRVVFHGWQANERVRGMMAGTTLFALPSLTEGFGLVYLEAMRAGKPVIATTAGGLAEAFAGGREALFVPPGDERALADAIRRLAADPALAAALGEAGRGRSERFSVQEMAAATERYFLEIAGDPSAPASRGGSRPLPPEKDTVYNPPPLPGG